MNFLKLTVSCLLIFILSYGVSHAQETILFAAGAESCTASQITTVSTLYRIDPLNGMGLTNVQIMIPFVRTVNEARHVLELLAENDLQRGSNDLKVIMMSELPTNALLADQYLEHFDGMSIGSNDMTQLTLGLDRDSALVADLFDERDEAVLAMLSMTIKACLKQGKYIGICGQGPSDHPDLARWLVNEGIQSMSLNPDSVVETWMFLAGEKV